MPRFIILLILSVWQTSVSAESTTYVDINRISVGKDSGNINISTKSNLLTDTSACRLSKNVTIRKGTNTDARDAVKKQYMLVLLAKTLDTRIKFSGNCNTSNSTFIATYITME